MGSRRREPAFAPAPQGGATSYFRVIAPRFQTHATLWISPFGRGTCREIVHMAGRGISASQSGMQRLCNFWRPRVAIALGTAAVVSVVGCVPLPMTAYEPEAGSGAIVYSTCSLNRHVSTGVRGDIAGIASEVSVKRFEGRWYVEWRLDVPEGATLVLADDRVRLRYRGRDAEEVARFPRVSLVDFPIVNATREGVPDLVARRQDITAPMVGGKIAIGAASSPRHFWLATYIEPADAAEIEVTLPSFTVNGTAAAPPPLRFRRGVSVIVATFNC